MLEHRNERGMTVYNPFRDLERMERSFFGRPYWNDFKTDIHEAGNNFILEADLPGFKKSDIKIDINGDYLTINAERHTEMENKDEQGNFVRCERSYGSYSRSFNVSAVKTSDIKAFYTDGVLKLVMPKKENEQLHEHRLEIE